MSPFSRFWKEAAEEGRLSEGGSSMVGDLECLHSACPSTVAGTPVRTPGLALQYQMEVLRSRISGCVDSTTQPWET